MQEEERLRKHREEQERIAREKAEEKKGTPPSDFTNSIGMKFVLIPSGEFYMGANYYDGGYNDEFPDHRVKIANVFYMGKYEVTQKQWHEIMGNNPSYFKGENLPVEMVSWNDVQEFIKKLNAKEATNKYRLPSEAEWEYAARAGTTTRYSFGYDEPELGEYAWYDRNSGSKTHEVGQKKPNPWGLYDMHGNVWEWVQDVYHSSYTGAPADGGAWKTGGCKIYRGDSWQSYTSPYNDWFKDHVNKAVCIDDSPKYLQTSQYSYVFIGNGGYRLVCRGGSWGNNYINCRSSSRFYGAPGGCGDFLGFRLLRSP